MKECTTCRSCFPDHINYCPLDGHQTLQSIAGEPILDGRYQLEKRLGQGGMGVVYKAHHVFLKSAHAIKVILPDLVGNDPTLATRFRQEAMAAAAIRHPNIIAVTDYGLIKGIMPFLVMEFIPGRSLHELLETEGKFSPMRAMEFMTVVAAGVGAAHQRGIVHRDLKPLNIMIEDNKPIAEAIKILDFGLAKIKSGDLLGSFLVAQTTGMIGSPHYMAPEQWSDEEPDRRADIYSLGIVLYQMLAGNVPFEGAAVPTIMKKHLMTPPAPFADLGVDVPPAVERVVRHALEKDPERRPPTTEEFIRELRAAVMASVAGGRPAVVSSPESDSEEGARTTRRLRVQSRVAEEARRRAEEEALRKAEEEAARLRAAAEARRREEEEARRKAEEEAARRLAAEEARRREEEQARLLAEAEARRREEEEARRKAEEKAARLAAEEARKREEEQARLLAEAEAARKRQEEEARRKAEEEAARRLAAEEARKRKEEEARRKAEEEAARRLAEEEASKREEEQARLLAEAARKRKEEEARRKAEEEAARLRAAEEARRREEEQARLLAEAEARKREEDEARRKAEEEAARRLAAEEERKREEEQARIAAAEAARRREEEGATLQITAEEAEERKLKERAEKARQQAEEAARQEAEEDAAWQRVEEQVRQRAEEEAARRRVQEEARQQAEETARRGTKEKSGRRAAKKAAGSEQKQEAQLSATVISDEAIEQTISPRPVGDKQLYQDVNQAAGELGRGPTEMRDTIVSNYPPPVSQPVEAMPYQTLDASSQATSFGSPAPAFDLPAQKKSFLLVYIGAAVLVLLFVSVAGLYLLMRPRSEQPPQSPGSGAATGGQQTQPASTQRDMVYIQGGTFQIGRDDGPDNEKPAHSETVKPFNMDKTEVTNAQYAEFVQATKYPAPTNEQGEKPYWKPWAGDKPPAEQEQWPVRNVSAVDAETYARWLSNRDGKKYRLPTEQEWEYVARNGGSTKLYPWGDEWKDGYANIDSSLPKPVGSYKQSATSTGVLDMIGNVQEWTSSDASFYDERKIPAGEQGQRVIRGGSYRDKAITATSRSWVDKTTRHPTLGFRLVREAP
jgi:formylglycine-generating enzyme required for sulfatase activity